MLHNIIKRTAALLFVGFPALAFLAGADENYRPLAPQTMTVNLRG
jgi:hypothetical protein